MAKHPTNTRELKLLKQSLKLSKLQHLVVIGTILGDGCLITSTSGKAARLQVRHKKSHFEYVEWKYKFFRDWVLTRPRHDAFNKSWYFRTISHPDLMDIRRVFYVNNHKIIPENISTILTNPLSLAIWFFDDGNGYPRYEGLRISSYAFGQEGNSLLQTTLQRNFNLDTSLIKDSKGLQLLFPLSSSYKLYNLIKPYCLPCMQYKLAALTP